MRDCRVRSGWDAVPDRHGVPAFLLGRGEGTEEEKGMQEKGNASRALLCDCLRIAFSRDMAFGPRDTAVQNGGNAPFIYGNYEIPGVGRAS